MEYFTLSNEEKIPAIGFGPGICGYSDKYKEPKSKIISIPFKAYNKLIRRPMLQDSYINAVAVAIKSGYRLIDYSASYGDGSLIKKSIDRSSINRNELFLTTRVSNRAQFSNTVKEEFFSQLHNLGVDYVDILMFHWPVTEKWEDTWLRMVEFYKAGYCRMLGVANCHQHHLDRIAEISDVMPVINQIEVHPLFTQLPLRTYCKKHGIQIEAYTPIARFDDRLMRLPLLKKIAAKYGKTVPQIVLRWHIENKLIPCVRSLNIAHQKANLDIFNFKLTKEEVEKIDSININARVRYDPDNCDFTIL